MWTSVLYKCLCMCVGPDESEKIVYFILMYYVHINILWRRI